MEKFEEELLKAAQERIVEFIKTDDYFVDEIGEALRGGPTQKTIEASLKSDEAQKVLSDAVTQYISDKAEEIVEEMADDCLENAISEIVQETLDKELKDQEDKLKDLVKEQVRKVDFEAMAEAKVSEWIEFR